MIDPLDFIDSHRYPIHALRSDEGRRFATYCRDTYLQTGLCMLPGFLQPVALDLLRQEANAISDRAHFCRSTHNPYLSDGSPSHERDGSTNRQETTFVGSVAYDQFDSDALLRRLYLWEPLKDFVGAVLGKTPLYRFADPFGACSINVFTDGGEHGWHFDESEFTVTLMLQSPEAGGAFEYVPQVRGRDDEQQIVRAVLDGYREGVVNLPFTAGTLLIFGGRQTLHRVTKVSGGRPRLVPVLCYSEQPGMENSASVRELFWGRPGPKIEVRP